MSTKCTEIHLNKYIQGIPKISDFNSVKVNIDDLCENQILVKNIWLSVDPYMRGRMTNKKSHIPKFELN